MFYLKYRPQTIAELDNKKIRESLGRALLLNNWGHAYLLVGPKGAGKTTTARLIAKVVNCTNRKKGEEPCNKCVSCRAVTAGTSLDVIEIDAASNTGVDDVRDLREKAKLAPSGAKFKVYIIDEVHMLSNSAFNALLKILEEPPNHVIFVLATTEAQKLPATVVSRCLVYNFGETTKEDVVGKLRKISVAEKLKIADHVLEEIAKMAGLAHRDAQKLLEQMAMGSAKDLALLTISTPVAVADQVLLSLLAKDRKKALQLINKFVEGDGKIRDLIFALVTKLREQLLSDIDDGGRQMVLINKLIEANSLLRDSPIPQLPLEMVIVEFCQVQNSPDISGVGRQQQALTDNNEFRDSGLSEISKKSKTSVKSERSETSDVTARWWPEVLAAVKPLNHSLVAFLRASRPVSLEGGTLTLEVFYKFHKERLEEKKNRDILEDVVSGILGADVKVKFVLAGKK